MHRLILITVSLFILTSCSENVPGDVVLFNFETNSELDQIHWNCYTLFSLSKEHVTHGTKSLRMELYPSDYPGLTPKLVINNWHLFKTFCFDIHNPEKREIKITVRIDDQKKQPPYANRYNKRFSLKPGPNRIHIPLDSLITSGTHRPLNLKKIHKISIFMVRPQKKYVLFIDNIHLSHPK